MSTPTPHQQSAIQQILPILASHGQCVLSGYAGTGKSFTTGWIARELLEGGYSVMGVTHAHKALAVLRSNLPDGVDTATVFSALGWRINGRTQSIYDTGNLKLLGVDVLLVDEASMIDARMHRSICVHAEQLGFGVLWIGDPAQLPPVGDGDGVPPVFRLVEQQFRLTEVVRQAADNPIIGASMYLRECLKSGARPDLHEFAARAMGGTIRITMGGVAEVASTLCSAIDAGLDARAVAWTNRRVDLINAMVGRYYHPPGSTRLVAGEPVTFGSTLTQNDKPVVSTDAMGRVLQVQSAGDSYGCLEVPCLRVSIEVDSEEIETVTPCDLATLNSQLRKYKRQHAALTRALKAADIEDKQDLYEQRDGLAALIWQCSEDYADVRSVYASTAHKAQGSTFEAVVVDWQDMQANVDNAMLARLLYVAVTRPSKYLVVVA